MTINDKAAQTRLRQKLDYELWLLGFLSSTEETFVGGKGISTITLTNRRPDLHRAVSVTVELGSGKAMKVMHAMSPLTFTASYKILDMFFEWILQENYAAGDIKDKIPWEFSKKIKTLHRLPLVY